MSKQTAIQWYVRQLETIGFSGYTMEEYWKKRNSLLNDALQMEREQIYHAWNDGCSEGIEGGQSTNCEEFYNNTYGSKYE